MSQLEHEIKRRRTFAIISHPDAGKTTLTEKILLLSGAIQLAGTIKGRKSQRYARSDWMAIEKQRGISVTTSVMQFPYKQHIVNLLDTPGHQDFSEDTYRTLTAVDAALMVIDAAKGVEPRTIKLMEVCRLRDTPIMTFINKLDREGRNLLEVLDEIEAVLKIDCVPITWPIGMGRNFKGLYHLAENKIYLATGTGSKRKLEQTNLTLDDPQLDEALGMVASEIREEIELVKAGYPKFNLEDYRAGKITPVYFGSAIHNLGINLWLDDFIAVSPCPQNREAQQRLVHPNEPLFTGFVFKIQANMDPKHRDRIAFLRICSGKFYKGIKIRHERLVKDIQLNNVLTFMAGVREQVSDAYPGDIIGIYNHGTIQIGDTFTQGESLKFKGVPNFAPELFRIVILKDPLKAKALLKGLTQLCEEGATQIFRPLNRNHFILGAVGHLQFDLVAFRLKHEYNVACSYEPINIATLRWVSCPDSQTLALFQHKVANYLALDGGGYLTYLAPSKINLDLVSERWPKLTFSQIREH